MIRATVQTLEVTMHSLVSTARRRIARIGTAAALAGLLLPLTAEAGPALLFDAKDGRVLYAEDADHVWHPASLTKIMTAYMTFEAIKAGKLTLQTRIPASEVAHAQAPSKIGLPVGATITVELALQALIIKSANDVAVMLAEAMGGTVEDFAKEMTAAAKRLGMTNTNFVNPHGLPAVEQVTTARDLGKLSRAVLRDFPEYAALWSQADMRIGKRRLRTHNGLLRTYDGADGLKTGFICDSGYNIVATATKEGRRIVAVVLGEPSGAVRNMRAASLLEHGFQTSSWRQIVDQPMNIDNMPIATDAKSAATSIRLDVLKRECNGGRRKKPAAVANVQQKRAELAKKATKQGAAPMAAGAPPAAAVAAHAAAKAAPSAATPAKPAAKPAQ